MAVQSDLSPATVEAAVQATYNTTHGSQSSAAQAGSQGEQSQHPLHHVADALWNCCSSFAFPPLW